MRGGERLPPPQATCIAPVPSRKMVVSLPRRDGGRGGRPRPWSWRPPSGRTRSSGGPLRTMESFQRLLLEAQFANSAPDSAPYMVDNDDATTTIAEATGTAIVNVVVGGDDIVF